MKSFNNLIRLFNLSLFLSLSLISNAWVGNGSASNPYLINDQRDYSDLQTTVLSGNSYAGKYFSLTQDIKLVGYNLGIGYKDQTDPINPQNIYFEGNFDGNNYTILLQSRCFYKGDLFCLFDAIRNNTISNLTVKGVHVDYCGLIDLADNSTVSNCTNKVSMSFNEMNQLSGIVNLSKGCTIINCANYGNIEGANWCAGIIGQINQEGDAHTLVKDCNNYGNIIATDDYAGGITANATDNLTIIHCSNQGKIYAFNYTGGIASNLEGNCSISTSMNSGDIYNNGFYCGGIVGHTSKNNTISYCGNYGNVNYSNFWLNKRYSAGIIGYDENNSHINYCIQTAKISTFRKNCTDPIVNRATNNHITKSYYNKSCYSKRTNHNNIIGLNANNLKGFHLRDSINGEGWTESYWIFESGEYPYPIPYRHQSTPVRANVRFMNDGVLYDYFKNISSIPKDMLIEPDNKFNRKLYFIGWSTDKTGQNIVTLPYTITDADATQHSEDNYDLVLYAIWSKNKNNKNHKHTQYHVQSNFRVTNNEKPNKNYYNNIIIEATGTLELEQNIHCNRLILKGVHDTMPQITTKHNISITNGWIFSRTINDSRWFHTSLPYNCKIKDIYSSNSINIYDRNWFIKKYDAEKRCVNGSGTNNWTRLKENEEIKKNRGYILGTSIIGKQTFYFKPSDKLKSIIDYKQEAIKVYKTKTNTTKCCNKNWNFIGNPFLHSINGKMNYNNTQTQRSPKQIFITYPIITDHIFFQQGTLEDLSGMIQPFLPMYLQADENCEINICENTTQRAPSIMQTDNKAIQLQISINCNNQKEKDNTNITFEEEGSSEYEIGYDYEKIINKGYAQIYSISSSKMMKNNNLPLSNLKQTSLGININQIGYYNIEVLNTKNTKEIYLLDHKTGEISDIQNTKYSFYADSIGINNQRFSIQVNKYDSTTESEFIENTIPEIQTNGQFIEINNTNNINSYQIYNEIGQAIISNQNINNSINIHLEQKGIYVVLLLNNQGLKYSYKVQIN